MEKYLIAGLGNPGIKYSKTRHNIGFMVIDKLAEEFSLSFRGGFNSDYAVTDICGKRVYFLKPQTFMNLSGDAVSSIMNYFKIETENILIIHDDIDMEFGKIKFKLGGSDGGHKGIRSIIVCISSDKFLRVKMGVGRSDYRSVPDFVLGDFGSDEIKHLDDFLTIAKDGIICYLNAGLKRAMNDFNKKTLNKEEN